MNSTFRRGWLASSEVISQVLFTSQQPQRNKMTFVAILSQIKLLVGPLVIHLTNNNNNKNDHDNDNENKNNNSSSTLAPTRWWKAELAATPSGQIPATYPNTLYWPPRRGQKKSSVFCATCSPSCDTIVCARNAAAPFVPTRAVFPEIPPRPARLQPDAKSARHLRPSQQSSMVDVSPARTIGWICCSAVARLLARSVDCPRPPVLCPPTKARSMSWRSATCSALWSNAAKTASTACVTSVNWPSWRLVSCASSWGLVILNSGITCAL